MKICACITLYHPNYEKLRRNLSQISSYCEKIYLLVNEKIATFDNLYNNQINDQIEVVLNQKNIGLSAAFNIALKKALKENFKLAILFDQDSILSVENFKLMQNEFAILRSKYPVVCIGPSLRVYGNNLETPKWILSRKIVNIATVDSVKNIIISGMLLDIEAALSIGGFDTSFPVDFCDFFFCYKALSHGFYVLKSRDAFIQHEIGNSNMKIGKATIHFHAPYRNYFLVRDTLRIVFSCKETPFSVRLRYLFFLPLRMVLFIIMLDKKKERLHMYYLGLKDFFQKKYGFGSVANLLEAN